MKEIWHKITEGPYEVSNLGRLRTTTQRSNIPAGHIIKFRYYRSGRSSTHGWFGSVLRIDGRRKMMVLHHLVAKYFLGDRPSGMKVVHLDKNDKNNAASNLAYMTVAEIWKHHGLLVYPSKEARAEARYARLKNDPIRWKRRLAAQRRYAKRRRARGQP